MLQKEIERQLKTYQDAYLGQDWMSANAVKQLLLSEDEIKLEVVLGYPFARIQAEISKELTALIANIAPNKKLDLQLKTKIEPHVGAPGIPRLASIKNIIAVASGKGGVGKSTVAINLALALQQEGARVGMMDADIYGPSQPCMLGAQNEKAYLNDKKLNPIKRHGIQSMSIGYLIDQNAPMVWRGPMIGKAMQQLLYDTAWDNLDYLIVDLPPGTGDAQLTLCQKIPVSAAVIVTTPQDLALLDVVRACEMFNKLNVPILGIIENMSTYHCRQCGHVEEIFGKGGGAKLAEQYGVALLASIPLALSIREMTDRGEPPAKGNSEYAQLFGNMARTVAGRLSLRSKDFSTRFPKVVVE